MHRLLVIPATYTDTVELYGLNVTNALLEPDTYLSDEQWCAKFCGDTRHVRTCRMSELLDGFARDYGWFPDGTLA